MAVLGWSDHGWRWTVCCRYEFGRIMGRVTAYHRHWCRWRVVFVLFVRVRVLVGCGVGVLQLRVLLGNSHECRAMLLW
jgi:hypothetical protein